MCTHNHPASLPARAIYLLSIFLRSAPDPAPDRSMRLLDNLPYLLIGWMATITAVPRERDWPRLKNGYTQHLAVRGILSHFRVPPPSLMLYPMQSLDSMVSRVSSGGRDMRFSRHAVSNARKIRLNDIDKHRQQEQRLEQQRMSNVSC